MVLDIKVTDKLGGKSKRGVKPRGRGTCDLNTKMGITRSFFQGKLLLADTKRTAKQVTWSQEVLESLPVPGPNIIFKLEARYFASEYIYTINTKR